MFQASRVWGPMGPCRLIRLERAPEPALFDVIVFLRNVPAHALDGTYINPCFWAINPLEFGDLMLPVVENFEDT